MKQIRKYLVFLAADFLLHNVILALIYYSKFNHLPGSYNKMLLLMYGLWVIDLVFNNKKLIIEYSFLSDRIYVLLKSSVFMIFCTAVVLSLLHLDFPRFFLLKIYGSVFLLETATFTIAYLIKRSGKLFPIRAEKRKHQFVAVKFIYDSILYAIAVLVVYSIKYGDLNLTVGYTMYISGLYALIIIVSDWMGKYTTDRYPNMYFALSNYARSAGFVFSFVALGVIVFSVHGYSRIVLFGPIVVLLGLELCVFGIRYRIRTAKSTRDVENTEDVEKIIKAEPLFEDAPSDTVGHQSSDAVLREHFTEDMDFYHFIDENLRLRTIDYREMFLCNFEPDRILNAALPSRLRLLICLYRVNDINQINRFFLKSHATLKNGGYLVGVKDTLESTKRRMYQQFPRYLATVLYILHFLISRVCPKLPVVKNVHYLIFRGKNNSISKAELLGRLSFCGFNILKVELINDRLYFIAKKIKMPSIDQNPSFGAIITLKRIGYQGQAIFIKKLRTMHPYSEYLQDYIVERNSLQSNGKIKDDFRITEWGKWLRRLWIDEWPQIINWIKGDITLIGVRALSENYFGLYPKDLRELRIQRKPGLIPPYYADMPKSFDEIVESERRYLGKKRIHPIRTDFVYFSKALINIAFKNARSR